MYNINFAENLKRIREEKGMSKSELARRVGVSDVSIGYWENGKTEPRMGKVEVIADVLGVKTDDLLFDGGPSSATSTRSSYEVPLYGTIAAGVPLEMVEVKEYVEIPRCVIDRYPNAFLLKVNGDSMNKVVPNGAYALIEPSDEANNGEVIAVVVNGLNATLKRYYQLHNSVVLEPDSYNSEFTPQIFDRQQSESVTVTILGKMVWYMSAFDARF